MRHRPGDVVADTWRIEARLGEGGMGTVWRAVDVRTGAAVALKTISASAAFDPEMTARFEREAVLAARVDATGGVARVHALRRVAGVGLVMVQELVEGEDLGKALRAGRLDRAHLVRLVAAVARTLAAIHAAGVVHRDLKPSNILVRARDGAPVLVDFGLAWSAGVDALTATGVVLGTLSYMAPEQALEPSKAHDPAVDVHALGAVLYEVLTGRPPRALGGGLGALAELAAGRPPPPPRGLDPTIDPALEALTLGALAHDPARRPTAQALADALAGWAPAAPRRTPPPAWILAALAVALCALGAVAGHGAWRARDARQQLAEHARWEPAAVTSALAGELPAGDELDARAEALRAAAGALTGDDAARAAVHARRADALARLTRSAPRPTVASPEPPDEVVDLLDALASARAGRRADALRLIAAAATTSARARRVERALVAEAGDRALLAWAAGLQATEPRRQDAVADVTSAWCRLVATWSGTFEGVDGLRAEARAVDAAAHTLALDAASDAWDERLARALESSTERQELERLGAGLRLVAGAVLGPRQTAVLDRACDALARGCQLDLDRFSGLDTAGGASVLRAARFAEALRALPGGRASPALVRALKKDLDEAPLSNAEVLVAAVRAGVSFGDDLDLTVLARCGRRIRERLGELAAAGDAAANLILARLLFDDGRPDEAKRHVSLTLQRPGDLPPRLAAEARLLDLWLSRSDLADEPARAAAERVARATLEACGPWPVVRQLALIELEYVLPVNGRSQVRLELWLDHMERLRVERGPGATHRDHALGQSLAVATGLLEELGRPDEARRLERRDVDEGGSAATRGGFVAALVPSLRVEQARACIDRAPPDAWTDAHFTLTAVELAIQTGDPAQARAWLERARAGLGPLASGSSLVADHVRRLAAFVEAR